MQAMYTDVQASKVPHNGAYPVDACNVLEAVQNLNEGDRRKAAAQGLVDMQEGERAPRKSKSSSISQFLRSQNTPPPLEDTASKVMFMTHRVSAKEGSN